MKSKLKILNNIQPYFTDILFIFFALLLTGVAFAAPEPLSTDPKSDTSQTFKTLRSEEGFLFSQFDTSWFNSPTPEDKKSIHLLFRSPVVTNGFQPIMTVRIDKNIGETKNIQEYVQQWMGDYSKLGYQVLGSQPFQHKNEVSYVIDVRNAEDTKSPKQIRQVVFFKRKQKAVILTCIDNISTFKNSLKECNKIIRSFAWDQTATDQESTQ